ncbi:MAG: molecular chaperone TorD family protein, partial [Plesiomonas shigelloides]
LHHTAGEPEDHIGLMLLTLAYLLEQEREEAVIELLREHLLPWSWRFVQLLQQATEGDFYPALSRILGGFLAELEYQLEICLPMIRLYR